MAVLIVWGMQLLFLFSYELVRYTDNHDEYLKAMGSPAALTLRDKTAHCPHFQY